MFSTMINIFFFMPRISLLYKSLCSGARAQNIVARPRAASTLDLPGNANNDGSTYY